MQRDVVRRGRLGGGRDAATMQFLSSMDADRRIAGADVLVDLAHAVMLAEKGVLGREEAARLIAALLCLHDDGIPESVFDDQFEDVHAGIESYLIETSGEEVGGRLHAGRSRNDEVATCIRIVLRSDILDIAGRLASVRRELLRLAGLHAGSVMPGFTHLQHAQPTTLGHHLLSYEQAFSRDAGRLFDAYRRVNLSPLGAAAFAGTGIAIDRHRTAELLGFSGPVINTMDAVASRDFALEVLADLAVMMTTVSRLCEELVIWSTRFVMFADLDEAYCSTSSIMPQKKNPDTAEILRAKCGSLLGAFVAASAIVKGLPMSYNRDLQELTPHLWQSVEDAQAGLGVLVGILASARFDTGRMAEEAGRGDSTATDLADHLVTVYNLPFRTAHSIVAKAVRDGGLTLQRLDSAAVHLTGTTLSSRGLTGSMVRDILSPASAVARRSVTGGPAPPETHRVADESARALAREEDSWAAQEKAVAHASDLLIRTARELAR